MAFGGQLPQTSASAAALTDYSNLIGAVSRLLCQLTGSHELTDAGNSSQFDWRSPADGRPSVAESGRTCKEESKTSIETAKPAADRADAVSELWRLFAATVERLSRTEAALRAREAQLAAAIPVVERPDEAARLADRLEALLRVAVETLNATSAALYLLDDATSELKLRAVWNLPKERFLQPARPLANQFADLEALLGHAVVLTRDDQHSRWQPPEPCNAAVCVPVSTPSMALGTLWVFDQRPRRFSDRQLELLEVIAGRVAADLERHVLLRAAADWQQLYKCFNEWGNAYRRQLPTVPPWLDHWRLHATYRQPHTGLPHEFYDWGVLPDGRTYLVVGGCHGPDPSAAMRVVALRGAIQAHLAHVQNPGRLLEAVNETLWTGSTADWQGSLFCALIDDRSSAVEYAGSGQVAIGVVAQRHARPVKLDETPLGSSQIIRAVSGELVVPRRGALYVLGPANTTLVSQSPFLRGAKQLAPTLARLFAARVKNRCPAKLIDAFLQKRIGCQSLQESTVVVARRLR